MPSTSPSLWGSPCPVPSSLVIVPKVSPCPRGHRCPRCPHTQSVLVPTGIPFPSVPLGVWVPDVPLPRVSLCLLGVPEPPQHLSRVPARARTQSTASRGASTSKTWPLSSISTCHQRLSPTSTAWAGTWGHGWGLWGCHGGRQPPRVGVPPPCPLRARRTARADNPGTALTFALPEEQDGLARIEDALAGGRGDPVSLWGGWGIMGGRGAGCREQGWG